MRIVTGVSTNKVYACIKGLHIKKNKKVMFA